MCGFAVNVCLGNAVVSFTLINADTDSPIVGFNPMSNNAVLNLATLPTRSLNIRANTSPGIVGSVRFNIDNGADFRTENGAPYTLYGDNGDDEFNGQTPTLGAHSLQATPYELSDARGAAGTPLTLQYTVIDQEIVPSIELSPTLISRSGSEGVSISDSTFTVRNGALGTLDYSITVLGSPSWLAVTPSSGNSSGSANLHTVDFSTASLDAGTYSATIRVSDPAAVNNPQTIDVVVTISPGNTGGSAQILHSKSADRSDSAPLEGQIIGGNVYIFVSVDSPTDRVRFYLNDPNAQGGPFQTENRAPWDLLGGSTDAANPLDTNSLGDGPQLVTAVVELTSGETETVHASYQIANGHSGDFNGDGDIDADDASLLINCLSGAGTTAEPGCDAYDLDRDTDVDLTDFGMLQLRYEADPNGCDPPDSCNGPQVGIWDRFEVAVTNTKNYGNRYKDVTLNVTYTRPDQSQVQFWGFYDGGDTWRLRFMPDQLGLWQYSATFSDGTDGTDGVFEVIASTIPGMIAPDPSNPYWIGYRGGRHELIRSLHIGDRYFAADWSEAERQTFLDWAQTTGYNTLDIASFMLKRDEPDRGGPFDLPNLWPLSASEWTEMETHLDELADRGILIFPFAGIFGQSSDFPTNQDDQEVYIRYTLARFGPYWNMMLNVAGPEPARVPHLFQDAMNEPDVNRLGTLIANLDPFGHILTVHNKEGDLDNRYKDSAWSNLSTVQGWKHVDYPAIAQGMRDSRNPNKALFSHECMWYGSFSPDFDNQAYSETHLRKKTFVMIMSGASVNFAQTDGDSSSGFAGSMDPSQVIPSLHEAVNDTWDFFDPDLPGALPFWEMVDRQDLTNRGYCLANPGQKYLVYLTSRQTVSVNVTGGTYQIQWINAQNRADIRNGGSTSTGNNLTPPNAGDDWLLYLTR